MEAAAVENPCTRLSTLHKNVIRSKIIKKELPCQYTGGEALLFWFADWMTGLNLIPVDQLRVVVETLAPRIITFGDAVEKVMEAIGPVRSIKAMERLPVCKIGFLDRAYVCMDGWDQFLNLSTGETTPKMQSMPLETIAYNLTSMFIRYTYQMRK